MSARPAVEAAHPAGVASGRLSQAQAGIQQEEYNIFLSDEPLLPGSQGAYRAFNRAQGFHEVYTAEGFRITPLGAGDPLWSWGLEVFAWGRGKNLEPVGPGSLSVAGGRADNARPDLGEWFVNGPRGLEHGMIIGQKPEGGAGDLRVVFRMNGNLLMRKDAAGVSGFMEGDRFPRIQYRDLRVLDADGAILESRMEMERDGEGRSTVSWVIVDGEARYPLAVDPLVTTSTWPGMDATDPIHMAWGDWDCDGDLDLAVANLLDPTQIFENVGLGFVLAWSSTETDYVSSLAWGDWDNDGDLDLAVGTYTNISTVHYPNRVYENTGGALSLAWTSPELEDTTSVAWGDWDGDGDLDLAVGNSAAGSNTPRNRVYENTGGGLTLAWSSTETDKTNGVAWGDMDGDGDLDLATATVSGKPNRVYANTGGALALAWSSVETDYTYQIAWGDYDRDGDLDLAVANGGGQPNRVYRNNGSGFDLVWSSAETGGVAVDWGDFDGDGDLDLAFGSYGGDPNRVYANNGGGFSLSWSSADTNGAAQVAWLDWDGDGDLDLATDRLQIYENVGGALAAVWTSSQPADRTRSVAWGDVDGDGDLDLAAGNYGQVNRVYTNTDGVLSPAWSSAEADNTTCVAWGDWDGDGDLDLAAGNYGQPNRVYANSGGALTLAWSSPETGNTTSVAWGDWDGDGDLDLAVGNIGNPSVRIYGNSGGALSLAWSSAQADNAKSVAWGDVDGDGDLDLAVGTANSQPLRLYENTGGALALAWSSAETDFTTSVAWGDWDGDGDLDLAVGNDPQPNRVYENTGGALSLAWSSAESNITRSVAWGDLDGDGDLDLAVGNYGQVSRVYKNTGGALSLEWMSAETTARTFSVAWGDLDGDGDLDLAAGNDGQVSRVYGNGTHVLQRGLPESHVSPAATDRPGATAGAYFYSSAERVTWPIPILYRLRDDQGDPVPRIIPEYSLQGGGRWLPATQGIGGDGTTNLEAGPSGTAHTFVWDAGADGAFSDNLVFRITVECQLPVFAGYPAQRSLVSAETPPFRFQGFDIGGRVWRDSDGDGIQDGGETGLAAVPVFLLDGNSNFVAQTATDSSGSYRFTHSYHPAHTVLVFPPSGYVLSPQNQGSDDSLDSDLDPATARTTVTGQFPHDVDAGMMPSCIAPDEAVWLYSVTKSEPDHYPILNFQDPNQPGQRTGWNIRRTDNPALPKSGWPLIGSNVVDMDAGTPNYQYTDFTGASGIWYYQITAYSSYCAVEGPF